MKEIKKENEKYRQRQYNEGFFVFKNHYVILLLTNRGQHCLFSKSRWPLCSVLGGL